MQTACAICNIDSQSTVINTLFGIHVGLCLQYCATSLQEKQPSCVVPLANEAFDVIVIHAYCLFDVVHIAAQAKSQGADTAAGTPFGQVSKEKNGLCMSAGLFKGFTVGVHSP